MPGRPMCDVRMLSGKLAIGDRFDSQDGMGRGVRFHIQEVEVQGKLTRIECIGPITFDDQFARFSCHSAYGTQRDPESWSTRPNDTARFGQGNHRFRMRVRFC